MRVFSDRLVNATDRLLVDEQLIPDLIKELFSGTEEFAMRNPILFGDYALAEPTDEEVEDPRLYEDLGDYNIIQ